MFIRTQENSRSGSVGLEGGNNLAKRLQTTHVRTDMGGEVARRGRRGRRRSWRRRGAGL